MKTVKMSRPYFYISTHYEPGAVINLPDAVADELIRHGGGTLTTEAPTVATNHLADSVDPLVDHADPLHAAKALGSVVEDHPGLVAMGPLANGDPKTPRTGRVMPADTPKPKPITPPKP